MNNNFNSDSLESLFREGLQDDQLTGIESDGWDMPSDAVWDNIETGITVRQIRGNRWSDSKPWLSVAATVLFITIFYQTLSTEQNSINPSIENSALANIQEQIDDLQNNDQSNDFQNNIASIASPSPTVLELTTTEKTNNFVVVTSKNIATTSNSTKPTPPKGIFVDKSQNLTLENKNESLAVSPKLERTPATTQSNHTNYLSTKLDKQTFASVDLNSTKMNFGAPELNKGIAYSSSSEAMIKPARQKNVYAGAYIGSNLTSTKVKGNEGINDLLDKQQFTKSSYQTGVKIGYQLSDKWSVETGLAYNKMQQQSAHELNFSFDSDEISLNAKGEYEGTYRGSLNTSYGALPVEVVLSHGATAPNIPDGQALPFALKSKQTLEMIQVPVSVRYALGNGRLKLHLSAGATANMLSNKDLKIALPLEGFNLPDLANVSYEYGNIDDEQYLDDINNLTVSLTAGVELDYALTNNLHLYAAPSYSKGLTPIHEGEEVETELSQASVLVGVNYFF